MARALLVALLGALCLPASALAPPLTSGLRTEILGIKPPIEGLSFRVVPGSDQLELKNETGRRVVMLGYEEEPYLRSDSRGVFVNLNASATYLNRSRYMGKETKVPRFARPTAAPRWAKLSSGATVAWHDHRMHWPFATPPPVVANNPDTPRRLFRWSVEGLAGSKPFSVQGVLRYEPSRVDDRMTWGLAGMLTLLAGVGAAFWFWRVREID